MARSRHFHHSYPLKNIFFWRNDITFILITLWCTSREWPPDGRLGLDKRFQAFDGSRGIQGPFKYKVHMFESYIKCIFYLRHYKIINFTLHKWKWSSNTSCNRLIYFFYFLVLLRQIQTPNCAWTLLWKPHKSLCILFFLVRLNGIFSPIKPDSKWDFSSVSTLWPLEKPMQPCSFSRENPP